MARLKERLHKLFRTGNNQTPSRAGECPGSNEPPPPADGPPPKVEFSGHSYLKKDGSAFLEAVIEPGIVTALYLEIAGQRFRPLEWQPLALKACQRRSYLFDLNTILENVDERELKRVVFVVKNPAGESRSVPFDISSLIM